MKTTLSERLKEAMRIPKKKVTGLALAKACGVSAPSVSDWINGATKSLDGVNLVLAAEFLKVHPKWLATGLGPRDVTETHTVPVASVQEVVPRYDVWPFVLVDRDRYLALSSAQQHQAQVRMMDEIEMLEAKSKLTGT